MTHLLRGARGARGRVRGVPIPCHSPQVARVGPSATSVASAGPSATSVAGAGPCRPVYHSGRHSGLVYHTSRHGRHSGPRVGSCTTSADTADIPAPVSSRVPLKPTFRVRVPLEPTRPTFPGLCRPVYHSSRHGRHFRACVGSCTTQEPECHSRARVPLESSGSAHVRRGLGPRSAWPRPGEARRGGRLTSARSRGAPLRTKAESGFIRFYPVRPAAEFLAPASTVADDR